MSDRPDLQAVLIAVNNLHGAAITLIEHARNLATDPTAVMGDWEEVPELLVEALIVALDLLSDDDMGTPRIQLLGALRRYIEGLQQP